MTEEEKRTMLILANSIHVEVDRIRDTDELSELVTMAQRADRHLSRMFAMKYVDLNPKEIDGYTGLEGKEELDCNDCYYSIQNCNDKSICCEDETALCDDFEPVAERKEE